jgi:hypothetical protein
MDKSFTPQRKNFRCVFNPYVTKDNRDGVIRSIISQFEGYMAEPEVTLHDDGFIITLTIGDNLSPSMARDKILWNQFIDNVTAADAIRKIQIIRLPKAGLMDFGARIPAEGSVGGFGPEVDPMTGDTGVDEKLNSPRSTKPPKYQIDGVQDDPLGHFASLRRADKTDMSSQGQNFVQELTPQDLSSNVNDVDSGPTTELDSGKDQHRSLPKAFAGFRRIAIDSDTGSSFTLNAPNGFQSVNDAPRDGGLHEEAGAATGIGGGAPISGASWYVTQPGNEQGTQLGVERNRGDASSGPLSSITAVGSKIVDEPEVEDVNSAIELPQSRGGTQSIPDGGQVEGWYASNHFGINEYYDYKGDVDGSEL